ncbi:hypothetical protein PENSPDRAFT_752356 [Peniophora sp. CONT]|nr:hypothetical protein PENSPDRAFT_752356 [Peniophora sp. CONT]
MKLFSVVSALLFGAVAFAASEPPTELEINSTFTPEDCSEKATTNDKIKVHYTGTLWSNGNKFDSSYDRGQPLPLRLGVGQVIAGWDQGLQGMCVGEKRTLTIPSHLAYGSRGFGNTIPANSALVFETELMGLEPHKKKEEL